MAFSCCTPKYSDSFGTTKAIPSGVLEPKMSLSLCLFYILVDKVIEKLTTL